ncbi:MAG: tetratricopeptide repeat protein [Verrucomicrobiales bacterium]|nr:tetratricopeptide repeat protein [Verrucomicrobiales bacterium]
MPASRHLPPLSAGALALGWLACLVLSQTTTAQTPPPPAAAPAAPETPQSLIERARAAYAAGDFATAEVAFERFFTDYGPAPEAQEAVRIHTPLLAVCKVATKKYAEALTWIDKAFADPKLDPVLADELNFWKGIALMTEGQLVEAQHAFGGYWANESHQPAKRYEALILFATLYLQQEFPAEAADFLSEQLPKIQDLAPEAASRAVVLQLYALLQAGETDRALALIREQYPRLPTMTQVISFQTLALQLGSRLLEEKRWLDAIACLQRIAPRERLLGWQRDRLADIDRRIAEWRSNPNGQSRVFQLEAVRRRVEREVANFEKIEHFDSALRLRLASAFQGMGRYREAALVMEDMLRTLPPDPVVDSASLALVQCWMQIARWPKAVEAAELYEQRFGRSGQHLATVLYLKAEALREDLQFGPAQLAYGDLVEAFPADPVAPKALFMQGFLYLQQDDNEGALYQFDQVAKKHPDSPLVDDAAYWSGMALSFSKDYAGARQAMQDYLDRFSRDSATPKYRKEAVFRIAVCTFSLGEYPESIALLDEFLAQHPDDPLADEARLLLGDALAAEGDIDRALAAYQAIRPESTRFHEEGWFKIGNARKLTGEFDAMRTHFERFIQQHPDSQRLPEAVYWLGWIDIQAGKLEAARDSYWQTIAQHGNRPDLYSMDDLIAALPKVYQGDGQAGRQALLDELEKFQTLAESGQRDTLALRCAWGRARVLATDDPARSQAALLTASSRIDPKVHNPLVTVDCADAQFAAGNHLVARNLYTEIRRWHPRTIHKDRLYAGLGRIAEAEGDADAALSWYDKFEKETAASAALGEIRLARARLLIQKGQAPAARESLLALLETPGVTAATKAETLYALGESHLAVGEKKIALPYFERIYVAYGRFADLNARAYLRRATTLEELGLTAEAAEVYRELAGRQDLATTEEARLATEKLRTLAPTPPEPAPPAEKGGPAS